MNGWNGVKRKKGLLIPAEKDRELWGPTGLPVPSPETKESPWEINTQETKAACRWAGRERRKYERVAVNLPVEYWPMNGRKSTPGHTENVGIEGLLLSLPASLEVGQRFGLTLFFNEASDFTPVEANVEVIWKDRRAENGTDRIVAVKFVKISVEDRERLKNYVHTFYGLNRPPV
jgi:hypothetical protein